MDNLIIETTNLTKKYGSFTAVDNLNLKVKKGEIYGFLGPNGAGKSTTIRMLLGLIKKTKGNVSIFGKSIDKNRLEILRKVGSLVESPSYYGNLTAYENLEITQRILELDKKEIDKVLEIVNLKAWKNKKVKKFSLGMKQRLAIGAALLGNPQLLILDEPTNGLDPSGIHEIRDLIINLPKIMGVTILISSHILSEIELMANSLGVISNGKLLYQGTLEELKRKHKPKICLKVSNMHEVLKELVNLGHQPEIKDNLLYLEKRDLKIEELNKKLVLEGYAVSHLSETKENLEELFLEMIGREAI